VLLDDPGGEGSAHRKSQAAAPLTQS
jgi:hypothetical protein